MMMRMKMMMWEEAVRGQECVRNPDSVDASQVTHTKLKPRSARSAENATKTRHKHWTCT